MRFTIDRKGQVLSAQVIKASRSTSLDAEAIAMLKRASPVPRPPDDFGGEAVELVIPIEFTIK